VCGDEKTKDKSKKIKVKPYKIDGSELLMAAES